MYATIQTAVNQDGRSASLTAPNGPSQQSVVRAVLDEGGLKPRDVCVIECHGTGTALGDPIEFGALRYVFSEETATGAARVFTTAKTVFGHMEAAAGFGGLLKSIIVTQLQCGLPNQHLRSMNPYITVDRYPAFFPTEVGP